MTHRVNLSSLHVWTVAAELCRGNFPFFSHSPTTKTEIIKTKQREAPRWDHREHNVMTAEEIRKGQTNREMAFRCSRVAVMSFFPYICFSEKRVTNSEERDDGQSVFSYFKGKPIDFGCKMSQLLILHVDAQCEGDSSFVPAFVLVF